MIPNTLVNSVDEVSVGVELAPLVAIAERQVLVVHVEAPELVGDGGAGGRVRVNVGPDGDRYQHMAVRVDRIADGRVEDLLTNHEQALIARVAHDDGNVHKIACLHDFTGMARQELQGLLVIVATDGRSIREGTHDTTGHWHVHEARGGHNQVNSRKGAQFGGQILVVQVTDSKLIGQGAGVESGILYKSPGGQSRSGLSDRLMEQTTSQGRQGQYCKEM